MSKVVPVEYYSDLLCVWAYFAQIRVDQLKQDFGPRIELRYRFLNLFGDAAGKIAEAWPEQGVEGYSQHILGLAGEFSHVELHPEVWVRTQSCSSLPGHLLLKAVQILEGGSGSLCEPLMWRLRQAFFRDQQDIASRDVLFAQLEALSIPVAEVESLLASGRPHAALAADFAAERKYQVQGSPSFVLNEGRQILYGNLGYRAIAANVQELLERRIDLPNWC